MCRIDRSPSKSWIHRVSWPALASLAIVSAIFSFALVSETAPGSPRPLFSSWRQICAAARPLITRSGGQLCARRLEKRNSCVRAGVRYQPRWRYGHDLDAEISLPEPMPHLSDCAASLAGDVLSLSMTRRALLPLLQSISQIGLRLAITAVSVRRRQAFAYATRNGSIRPRASTVDLAELEALPAG